MLRLSMAPDVVRTLYASASALRELRLVRNGVCIIRCFECQKHAEETYAARSEFA